MKNLTPNDWEELLKTPPKRIDPPNTDPLRMLNHAVAFWEAGHRCEVEDDLVINPGAERFLGAPEVVSFAFAVEVYLKLLHRLTRGTYSRNVHNLLELYKGKLIAPADYEQGVMEQREGGLDEAVRSIAESHFDRPFGITRVLEDEALAFIDWRYPYEWESCSADPRALARVGTALHKTVRHIAPKLVSVFEEA